MPPPLMGTEQSAESRAALLKGYSLSRRRQLFLDSFAGVFIGASAALVRQISGRSGASFRGRYLFEFSRSEGDTTMQATRILGLLLLCAVAVTAQTNRGGINGTVTDPNGAAVPGATVTITNVGTGKTLTLTTSDVGAFFASSLEPVTYNILVEAPGFKKAVVEHLKVDTASIATANVRLETGGVSEQVTVVAEEPLLNTESGTTGSTITERQLSDLPLNNRSVLDLAATLPNISGDVGFDQTIVVTNTTAPGFNLSLNGGRPGSTLMLADGVNNTGVSLSRAIVTFSPETVQEFTVQTSAYSAEYGTTGGGIINITTKGGTNELHGVALAYMRGPKFSAAPWSNAVTNRPVATLRSSQYSFSAGGPVVIPKIYNGRNRTFFFAAFEPYYRQDHVTAYALLPTDAMRGGDFSNTSTTLSNGSQVPVPNSVISRFPGITFTPITLFQTVNLSNGQFTSRPVAQITPFTNNMIPSTFLDASALKSLQFVPSGGDYFIDPNGQLENYTVLRFVKEDDKRLDMRFDQEVTSRNHMTFRLTRTPGIGIKGFGSPVNGNGADYSVAKQILLSDRHTFSPTLINDLRLNYTRGRFSNNLTPEFDALTGRNLNTELGLPNLTHGGIPLFTNGLGTFGNIGSGGSTQVEDVEERYTITDIVYLSRGNKSWKFGADLNHAIQNVASEFTATGGSYAFTSALTTSNGASNGTGGLAFASFLMGVPNTYTLKNALIPFYYRWNSGALFVQNDWKVKPNLTLNLGLRYSLELPRTEKYDHQGVFRIDEPVSINLPSPVTLPGTGQVLTSFTVPTFEFSGRGGRSRYLYPADYKNFEPRFGFAWSPDFSWNKSHNIVIRGGYGVSHVPVNGFNRLPKPDFATSPSFTFPNENQVNPGFLLRLGTNPPSLIPQTPDQAMAIPSDGVVTLNSLRYQAFGFAISPNTKTPYIQNWNLGIEWQIGKSTVIEFSYVGAKGTHLFMPNENVNPKNVAVLNGYLNLSQDPNGTIPDPLGRTSTTGSVIAVQRGSLGSPFQGFSSIPMLFDGSANSIRHAGYVSVTRRVSRGFAFTSNYTYGKSIDDASDSGTDKNVLSVGRTDGQVALGGTRVNDRSVSIFDVRHIWNSTFLYDVPFGRGRRWLQNAWGPVQAIAGGWTLTGTVRFQSGFPAMATLSDTNLLGDLTHTTRPNIVAGVPIVNPLFNINCPVGNLCQPYLNPAAFERPPKGTLGNAPRTLDVARGPWSKLFDASVQKDFPLGEKRKIQIRVDFINAFNHPNFRVFLNNAGGTDFMGAPSEANLTSAEFNAWAAQHPGTTATLASVNALIQANRIPGSTTLLPNNFFSVPLPADFWSKNANQFDITTTDGLKLYRLRQAYNAGFGQLYYPAGGSGFQTPRYIQFGLKLFF